MLGILTVSPRCYNENQCLLQTSHPVRANCISYQGESSWSILCGRA